MQLKKLKKHGGNDSLEMKWPVVGIPRECHTERSFSCHTPESKPAFVGEINDTVFSEDQ